MTSRKPHWIYAKLDDQSRAYVDCPTCNSRFRVLAKHDGRRVKCPKCSCPFDVMIEDDEEEVEKPSSAVTLPRLVVWLVVICVFFAGYFVGRNHYHYELQNAPDIETLRKVFEGE